MDPSTLPETFSSVTGLGNPLGYYPVRHQQRVGRLVVGLIFLLAAMLVFAYGLWATFLAVQQHGPALIAGQVTLPLIVAGLLLILGLLEVRLAHQDGARGVALYEAGLAHRGRRGIQVWAWQEILSIHSSVTRQTTGGVPTRTTHLYILVNRAGQRLRLDDAFEHIRELGQAVEQATYPGLYDRAAAQYNAGAQLAFGPVAISRDGLRISRKNYPWGEIREVKIRRGVLRIWDRSGGRGSRSRVRVEAIPNLRVLLSLIDQKVGLKTG